MLEEELSLLVDAIRDESESSHKSGEEDKISGKVDNMGPPSGGTFYVNV